MLKDLDERSSQQVNHTSSVALPQVEKSHIKAIVITVFIMLILTAACFFTWTLYQENQQFKHDSITVNTNNESSNQVPNNVSPTSDNLSRSNDNALVDVEPVSVTPITPVAIDKPLQKPTKLIEEKSLTTNDKSNATDVKNTDSSTKKEALTKETTALAEESHVVVPSSLTISRKNISPEALAKQKMNKAERAIAENELILAEQLFEEILLITPKNDIARKQLAALWFGRKSYQPALNLLQQGIITSPNNEEFRLMKARIHLTVGQVEKAYDVLSPLDNNDDIEYQSLLANAAQQIGNFKAAAKAYLTLVNLAPQQGRYWLGLAIAYDSNSEFLRASKAYQSAITQGGLSNGALNFTKQRLAELGE